MLQALVPQLPLVEPLLQPPAPRLPTVVVSTLRVSHLALPSHCSEQPLACSEGPQFIGMFSQRRYVSPESRTIVTLIPLLCQKCDCSFKPDVKSRSARALFRSPEGFIFGNEIRSFFSYNLVYLCPTR